LLDARRRADSTGTLAAIPRLRETYISDYPSRRLADPATGQSPIPRALGGPELPPAGDPRTTLFEWLMEPDNPYFARAFVNRVWAVYFGVGLVDPVDGFSVANPASNEQLLAVLATDFVTHDYNIRRLERLVLISRAYQRSSSPREENLDDHGNFARATSVHARHCGGGLTRACAPSNRPTRGRDWTGFIARRSTFSIRTACARPLISSSSRRSFATTTAGRRWGRGRWRRDG
jgi:hypothetical protein